MKFTLEIKIPYSPGFEELIECILNGPEFDRLAAKIEGLMQDWAVRMLEYAIGRSDVEVHLAHAD